MNISPFILIIHPCEEVLPWVMQKLLHIDLQPTQTFDLQVACLGRPEYFCPDHGMNLCDCQMVVLLVYGKAAEPATLILHGNNGRTWLSIANDPQQRGNTKMIHLIQQTLSLQIHLSPSE